MGYSVLMADEQTLPKDKLDRLQKMVDRAEWAVLPSFAKRVIRWQGARTAHESAALLGIPYTTYRKYRIGKRTPNAMAMMELERRMAFHEKMAVAK